MDNPLVKAIEAKLEVLELQKKIQALREALQWYANKDNIESRIKETSRWSAGEWITSTSMYDDVTKVAEKALEDTK